MNIPNEAEITGTVVHVGEVETISERFSKRTIVVETDEERYPQQIAVEFTNDRASMLDGAAEGMTAGGKPPRYFVSLNGWRIDLEGGAEPGADVDEPAPFPADGDDGIPF
jgi:hypothetical protein